MKSRIYRIEQMTPQQLEQAAALIDGGAVAVYPTDTVYGIGACAFDEGAIRRIYQIKQRPAGAALQILTGSVEQARQITQWSDDAEKLAAAFWPGALTIILRPNEKGEPLRRGFEGLGLRVPAHPPLARLLGAMKYPLASTSANLHGRPVFTREDEVTEFFDGKADIIFAGGTLGARASSVLDLTGPQPVLLRQEALSRKALEKVLGKTLKQL